MRRSVVIQFIATIMGLALSVAVAHAGGGPGVIAFSAFFECQTISTGTNVNEVVSIHDPTSDSVALEPSAIVGLSTMACRQVEVRDSTNTVLAPPASGVLKCYSLAVQGGPAAGQFFNFTDAFGTETNVRVLSSRYLCGTASESQ